MAIIWVLEKPRPAQDNLPDLLQGDFAVRAFASLRSFYRLSNLGGGKPDLIVVRACDYQDELENLDQIIALQWPTIFRLYLGSVPDSQSNDERRLKVADESWLELPFLLQQILRNSQKTIDRGVQFGDLWLDADSQSIRILPEGDWQKLSPKEFQLLKIFLKHPGHCLSHEDLNEGVWKGVRVASSSVASHISRLRRYLSSSRCQIKSVYGGGYQMQMTSIDE